jgi:hypothetical protein
MEFIPFPPPDSIASDLLAAGYTYSAISSLNPSARKKLWLKETVKGNRLLLSNPAAREYGIDHGWVGIITSDMLRSPTRYELTNPVSVSKRSKDDMMKDLSAAGFSHPGHFVDLTDDELYAFWKQQCRPTPEPAKPAKRSVKPPKPFGKRLAKRVVTGNPGETLINVELYERSDPSKPMKNTPRKVSKYAPVEVVYAQLEADRKARESRTSRK